MSDTRRWTRPRTRVYDCNYNLGEQYYKPVVDSLDRKYGGGIADRLAANDEPFSRRSPFESSGSRPSRAAEAFDAAVADEEFDVGASLQRLKASRAARQELEDELESISSERMLKKKAASAAAARESLLEDELESALTSGGRRRKATYSEQLLDTVGVNGKMHEKLVDEVSTFRRKAQSAIDDFNEEVPRLTKWTALNANSMTESLEESAAEAAAKARARKSKARLADLDAEMEALTERGQQREMRVKGLRSLLAETSSSVESSQVSSSVQVERKRERKVNF